MWSSPLLWKILIGSVGLNLTLAFGFLLVVSFWQRDQLEEQMEQRLRDTALVLRSHVGEQLRTLADEQTELPQRERVLGQLQQLVKRLARQTRTRLTLIDVDGQVLADSERDPQTMNNHRDRPELIEALQTGLGSRTRRSSTLGIDMFYLAVPCRDAGRVTAIIRVAVELETINQRMADMRRFLWLFAAAVACVAIGLTYFTVGRFIRPLAQLTSAAQAIAAGKHEDPVLVESRDEVGMLGAAFNQMQRQLAQRLAELRENADRMTTVLSSVEEGIIAIDADERIVLANEASRNLLGFVTDSAVGRPLLEATRSQPLYKTVQRTLQSGQPTKSEFESNSEPRRALEVRATSLPGESKPGVVVTLHDVTGLRRLENLRHEFVANVSHELKTPLAAIKAYAETLRMGAINDAANNLSFVENIEEQADRLHELILDMLQIARVESGQQAFEITAVSVDGLVNTCFEQHATAAERKQLALRLAGPDTPLIVRVDEDGLRTILDNLIDNAIKYTPAGGEVTIRWFARDAEAILEVQDTGIGIAAEDQQRVFERFFRVDKARSRELGGTGLGLSIVKHLSQSFGGSVTLQSELGSGSTFRVHLPLL